MLRTEKTQLYRIEMLFLGHECGVKPFQMHGYGMHPCVSEGVCFSRGAEVELHPYSMDVRVIFPVVATKIEEILQSKCNNLNTYWQILEKTFRLM